MKSQIETLKRDIEIHKEVEKELAKRSHFCQKVIKRLRQQVKDLEAEKADVAGKRGSISQGQTAAKGKTPVKGADSKANEDLINFLEHKLEEIEKKLSTTQNEYEVLQGDYLELQEKLNQSREKYKRAALLLTDFLDDMLTNTPNILQSEKDMHLNLDRIKDTPIEELEKEDKIALVLVLLKQLQPYLSANNLNVQPPKGYKGQPKQGDDSLNKILNNINVQTKKSELASAEAGRGRDNNTLPPIKGK